MIFPWRFSGVLSHGRVFKKLPNRCFKITSNNFLFLIRIFVNFYHHFGDCPRWSSMDFARLDGGGLPTARSVAARICLVSHGAFKRRRGRPMFRSETCQKYGKVYRKPWFHWWKSAVMGCFTLQEQPWHAKKNWNKLIVGEDLYCCYLINTE